MQRAEAATGAPVMKTDSYARMVQALTGAGIVFLDANDEDSGVRLRRR